MDKSRIESNRGILVVGVTGQVGGLVAHHLHQEHGLRCMGLTRNVPKVEPSTFVPVQGDLEDPESLSQAVEGCSAIFLASPLHPRQSEMQMNLVRAAQASGSCPRLVKLSGLSTSMETLVDSGRWHAEIEQGIAESGLPAVALRPHFFMQNLRPSLLAATATGRMAGPAKGRVAMVDVRDVAEVAAELLLREFDGFSVLTLTGDDAHSFDDVTRIASDVAAQAFEFAPLGEAEVRAQLEETQMPAWHIGLLCQFNAALAAGVAEQTTDDVQRTLGRRPRRLRDTLVELLGEIES